MRDARWENAGVCALQRDRVAELAKAHWREADDMASAITLPWYRVQAYASVAEHCPEDEVDAMLAKASEAARDTDEYRRWTVLAWVIEAAVERGRMPVAKRLLADALEPCTRVTPLKSRAYGLQTLLERAVRVGEREAQAYGDALLDAAAALSVDPAISRRKWARTFVNRTAYYLSRSSPVLATRVLEGRFGAEKAAALLARHGSEPTKT